jgi:hypothetical protein
VTVDAKGRVWIDPEAADREWEASTRAEYAPLSGPTRPRAGRSPPAAETASLVERLLAIVAEVQADTREGVARYLPHVVEGAAEALRAAGLPMTAPAIAEALCLADGLDGHGLTIASALIGAVEDPDSTPETIREQARREGRAAVAWRCPTKGGTDGEE